MTEILAPAGGEESAYAAINTGADAVYLGLTSFSARSSAENFNLENLKKVLGYAHIMGVKVYVAMNTLVKQSEVEVFLKTVVTVWNLGADAIILQDMFLGKYIKELYPEIELHLSTQAGVCNELGAKLAKDCGFSRVILARETKLEDIKKISKIIQTEAFVQGALCTCFSGQCYMSSFIGGNSGNRGRCKQPCRKKYSFNRKGYEEFAYRLSLSDLCVGQDVKKLIEAGVSSFKIEGRMRRSEYVVSAVNYYKNVINGKDGDLSSLKRAYNRGNYTKGLAFGQDKSFISSAVQGHIGEYVGRIKVVNGKYFCECLQKFENGDGFKILRDGKEIGGGSYGSTHKLGVEILSRQRLKNGDKVFITTDASQYEELVDLTLKKKRIEIFAKFKVGKVAEIEADGIKILGDDSLEEAKARPLTKFDVEKCFNKTDVFPFQPVLNNVQIEGDIFITAATLNALRRKTYQTLFDFYANGGREEIQDKFTVADLKPVKNNKTAAIISDLNSIMCDIIVVKPSDYGKINSNFLNCTAEKYLYLPPYLSGEEINRIIPLTEKFDGIYCDGYYGLALAEKLNKNFFAGTGFNLANAPALSELNVKYLALSKELTVDEIKPLACQNTFYLTAGDVKVMDLIYCPFEKSCAICDKLNFYTLTDENGREFAVRRYKTSECRFEIFNCATLLTENMVTGALYDFTSSKNAEISLNSLKKGVFKEEFKNYTKGHGHNPVL